MGGVAAADYQKLPCIQRLWTFFIMYRFMELKQLLMGGVTAADLHCWNLPEPKTLNFFRFCIKSKETVVCQHSSCCGVTAADHQKAKLCFMLFSYLLTASFCIFFPSKIWIKLMSKSLELLLGRVTAAWSNATLASAMYQAFVKFLIFYQNKVWSMLARYPGICLAAVIALGGLTASTLVFPLKLL